MNIKFDRLYKLCDFAESLPEEVTEHFNMKVYFDKPVPETPSKETLLSCGTAACMLGWAATSVEFRRLGLHVVNNISVGGAEEAFGIEKESKKWSELFGSNDTDKSPKEWAARARKVLQRWQEEEEKACLAFLVAAVIAGV